MNGRWNYGRNSHSDPNIFHLNIFRRRRLIRFSDLNLGGFLSQPSLKVFHNISMSRVIVI